MESVVWVVKGLPFYSVAGTKGKTDLISLDSDRTTSKEANTDEYSIEAMDVGEVLMINLRNDGGGWCHKKSDWFVNKIHVTSSSEKESFDFPYYGWVSSGVTVIQRGGNCRNTVKSL